MNEAANVYFVGTAKSHASDEEESTGEEQGNELFINTCLDDTLPWVPLTVDRHEPIFPQAMTLYKRPNFDFRQRLNVSFARERGIDQGPAKNFSTLLTMPYWQTKTGCVFLKVEVFNVW